MRPIVSDIDNVRIDAAAEHTITAPAADAPPGTRAAKVFSDTNASSHFTEAVMRRAIER